MRPSDIGTILSTDYIPHQVITTRSYDERLGTIAAVRDAGISVCSGGILGLGESTEDRVGLIWEVSSYVTLCWRRWRIAEADGLVF